MTGMASTATPAPEDDTHPVPKAGSSSQFLVQTASLYFLGSLQGERPDCLLLNEVVVILNTGRLDVLLRDGAPTVTFQAVELPPELEVRIERAAMIWSCPWLHPKPRVPVQ